MKVAIVDYGAGNIQSLRFALDRLGVESVLTAYPEVLRRADKVIFPGVGEASSAMKKLRATGLDTLLPTLKQPVLGICRACNSCVIQQRKETPKVWGFLTVRCIVFQQKLKFRKWGGTP